VGKISASEFCELSEDEKKKHLRQDVVNVSKRCWTVSGAQISGIFASDGRKLPCVWFPKLDGTSGLACPENWQC